MKPYKLKHIPTGLYYQPHKHRGSHLSKSGKIYQTASNGLSDARGGVFRIFCQENSRIHLNTKNILAWHKNTWQYEQVEAFTNVTDWVKEEI